MNTAQDGKRREAIPDIGEFLGEERSTRGGLLSLFAVSLATFIWTILQNGTKLDAAWGVPDVVFYLRMAGDRFDLVPQPFCLRPLSPLLARWIALWGHWPVKTGFSVVAFASLGWTLVVVCWLLSRSFVSRWFLLAVAVVPFWPQMLAEAGLPDPLYAALLATLLLTLEYRRTYLAAFLMLPLMVARESTAVTLLCFLAVSWRELGWLGSGLGIASAAAGAIIVRHLSAGSLPNPEHMNGGLYILGKVLSNTTRSTGVIPWSNVYPSLCTAPRWAFSVRLGPVRTLGVCGWSPQATLQMLFGFLVPFGSLPLLLPRAAKGFKHAVTKGSLTLRFSVIYGGLSLLLAPAIGTWYLRLFGYGWPLLLVALPRVLRYNTERSGITIVEVTLIFLHLAVCIIGTRPIHAREMVAIACLQAVSVTFVFLLPRHATVAS